MPKLDGVLETSIYVDDLQRSVLFYRTILGFEVIDSNERLCALSILDRQILLVFKKEASANLALGAHDGKGRLHLAFAVPFQELPAWEAWLLRHKVAIEHRRVWERGGPACIFEIRTNT